MKGIISMSTKETERISVLDRLMRKEIKQRHASEMLGLSVRQVRRLAKRYKQNGASGITHQLRGGSGNHMIDTTELKRVVDCQV